MTYFMERTGVDCVPGAEELTFGHGDTAECHAEPPTCGCPEVVAEHNCQYAAERGLTPAQATDLCPRCQHLLNERNDA